MPVFTRARLLYGLTAAACLLATISGVGKVSWIRLAVWPALAVAFGMLALYPTQRRPRWARWALAALFLLSVGLLLGRLLASAA
jgi:hypothetical protein